MRKLPKETTLADIKLKGPLRKRVDGEELIYEIEGVEGVVFEISTNTNKTSGGIVFDQPIGKVDYYKMYDVYLDFNFKYNNSYGSISNHYSKVYFRIPFIGFDEIAGTSYNSNLCFTQYGTQVNVYTELEINQNQSVYIYLEEYELIDEDFLKELDNIIELDAQLVIKGVDI